MTKNDTNPKNAKKNSHGGPRNGAGRPPAGRVQITVRMRPESIAEAKARAEAERVRLGELFELLLSRSPSNNTPL